MNIDRIQPHKVFISFRCDNQGLALKNKLASIFDNSVNVIDCSESEDRSNMTPDTIKKYLYKKLSASSVTIVILTRDALSYERNIYGDIDDWIYDETRYSLEDRDGNRTNGLIALYTDETKPLVFSSINNGIKTFVAEKTNLCEKNVCNVKNSFKKNQNSGYFDLLEDCYCSFISFDDFCSNTNKYIQNAVEKRERIEQFNIVKKMD